MSTKSSSPELTLAAPQAAEDHPQIQPAVLTPGRRRALLVLGALVLWELLYRVLAWKPVDFPAPSHVVEAIRAVLTGASHHAPLNALLASSSHLLLVIGFALVVRATTVPRALVWAALIGAWEGAFRVVQWKPWVFPAPSHVLDALSMLVLPKQGYALFAALAVSGSRLAVGFSIAVVAGALLGMALYRFRRLDDIWGGFLLGLQTLPSVCWVPLAVLAFGLDEMSVQFVLVMGSTFAIAIALRDGLRIIPPIYQRAGLMLGASGAGLYRHVLLPASLPALASSFRQGFSFAWRSLMGAELVFMVEGKGVGYLLHQGREFADVAQVVGVMLVMISVGVLADRALFARLEDHVTKRFGLRSA